MKKKLLTIFLIIISYMLINFICVNEIFAVNENGNTPSDSTTTGQTDEKNNTETNNTNENKKDDTSKNTEDKNESNNKKDITTTKKNTTTQKSSEARLNDLGIRPKNYDFAGFKKDTMSYKTTVPNDVKEVTIYATAVDAKAKIKGAGKVSLKEGENEAKVVVTAEDGKTTKTYTIKITREVAKQEEKVEEQKEVVAENEEEKELGLTKLTVSGIELSPKFDTAIYEYKAELSKDLSELDINAEANNTEATVEIIGNKNLQPGENIITILLSNANKEEFATYQIIVNKEVKEETVAGVSWKDPSTWGLKEKIIVGIIGAIILLIIILIIVKVKKAREEDDDLDLPGAEELDRALTEHQELNEDVEEEKPRRKSSNFIEDIYSSNMNRKSEEEKSDIEKAQEYFEEHSRRRGRHF